MKQLFLSTAALSMQEQCNVIEKAFDDWIGSYDQTDDVTVLGIKINILTPTH